jgi:hypothetical protein
LEPWLPNITGVFYSLLNKKHKAPYMENQAIVGTKQSRKQCPERDPNLLPQFPNDERQFTPYITWFLRRLHEYMKFLFIFCKLLMHSYLTVVCELYFGRCKQEIALLRSDGKKNAWVCTPTCQKMSILFFLSLSLSLYIYIYIYIAVP